MRVVYLVNVKAGIFLLTRHHPGSADLFQRDYQTILLEWDFSLQPSNLTFLMA